MDSSAVIDLCEFRLRRLESRRQEAASFPLLPCPSCDTLRGAAGVVGRHASYVCDGFSKHPVVEWTSAGDGTAFIDGRVRRFFSY